MIKSFNNFNKTNEHQETQNYMFFGNLQTIKRLVDEMLEMDESKLDSILSEHDWASDHISVATENLEQVFDFLAGHDSPEHSHENEMEDEYTFDSEDENETENETEEIISGPEVMEQPEDELETKNIKNFNNFK